MAEYYANCSTDKKIQIVGPFPDILAVTDYGFRWSVKNDHEPRWHVVCVRQDTLVVERLTPDEAFVIIGYKNENKEGA